MYVLGVRCVVCVKGLGETYTTLDRRLLLTAAVSTAVATAAAAAEVDESKTGQAGNFKIVDIFNAEKIQRRT